MATLKTMGLRVIMYIDDKLIMAETAREHTAGLIFLLENLGFIINNPDPNPRDRVPGLHSEHC